jgi:tRNA pseudouridine55 synthase
MGRRRRHSGDAVDGVILIDKPIGPTSHDVVQRVRRALNAQKAGHTGTLDPMATGLLEVCLGRATRLVPFLTADDKRYEATLKLGVGTDTLDAEGEVLRTNSAQELASVDQAALEGALEGFRGEIQQRPPMYSAIKVDGKPLHERARAGEVVEVPLRTVVVHAFDLHDFASPLAQISAHVSKGTYIRTLAADLAGAVGLEGHLVALRRTAIAQRTVEQAIRLEDLEADSAPLGHVIGLADAVAHLPTVVLDEAGIINVRCGRAFAVAPEFCGRIRILDSAGALVAIAQVDAEGAGRVERGFPAA